MLLLSTQSCESIKQKIKRLNFITAHVIDVSIFNHWQNIFICLFGLNWIQLRNDENKFTTKTFVELEDKTGNYGVKTSIKVFSVTLVAVLNF